MGAVCGPVVGGSGGGCGGASYMASSPDSTKLYVQVGYANKVAVVDTATNTVVATAPGGSGPGLVVSHNGQRLYEMNLYNLGLTVVDIASMSILTNFFPPTCSTPEGIGISPDDTRLVVPCLGNKTAVVLDTAGFATIGTIDFAGLQNSPSVAFTPDSAYVYLAACCVFPPTGNVVVAQNSTGAVVNRITVSVDNDLVIGGRPPSVAQIQPPVNANGTSVFNASRGVIPVKFTLTSSGNPTCALPPATIAIVRMAGNTTQPVNQQDFEMPSDSGINFRVDGCQYVYNVGASGLGAGNYLVQIKINGSVVGTGTFGLR
jgi:YVTN family beta-propeller protein